VVEQRGFIVVVQVPTSRGQAFLFPPKNSKNDWHARGNEVLYGVNCLIVISWRTKNKEGINKTPRLVVEKLSSAGWDQL
jgi:hypothetical protein